ncbi:hypothetical protein [Deinococcus knuensis]|uniref:Uncharacterized protein n=1 Tax=Deinococcus knuensis TaxID=1837380 RepID=A0ABQ2SCX6_9DEIO|nr:hypothetical protein [Deinococcus knuensis]GGS21203.1 hypothetical protein GCM10008961_11120 [Deinococcus knuensis]
MLPADLLTRASALVRRAPPLWPGFTPATIPLVIFDGQRSWLRGPRPADTGWTPAPAPGGGFNWSWPGRHPALGANTAVTLPGGVVAAGVLLPSLGAVDAPTLASVLVHEAFHVYQQATPSVAWEAAELAALTYPAGDPDVLHARAEETAALALALTQRDCHTDWHAAARDALTWRALRHARLADHHRQFEIRMETREGLAQYVETRFLNVPPTLNAGQAATQTARAWTYDSGAALAHLLDRTGTPWQAAALTGTPLHALLGERTGNARITPATTPSLLAAARDAAQGHARHLQVLDDGFHAQDGQHLTVTATSGLHVTGFDPMNLHALNGDRVLHTRLLTVRGSGAHLHLHGAAALAQGHDLLSTARLEVRGLPEPDTTGGLWQVRNDRVDITLPVDRVTRTPGGWHCTLD